MPPVAIFIRTPGCVSFLSPVHSEEISSKLAQFLTPSLPAGEMVRLARVVHSVPAEGEGSSGLSGSTKQTRQTRSTRETSERVKEAGPKGAINDTGEEATCGAHRRR